MQNTKGKKNLDDLMRDLYETFVNQKKAGVYF